MKLFAYLSLVAASALFTATAQAEFVYTDWKSTGDKQAVLDTSTGVEWLRLSNTNKKSISTVLSELDTIYAGWRLPTNAEVSAMIRSVYGMPTTTNGQGLNISVYSTRSGGYRTGANKFINLFGNGHKSLAHHAGLYYDEDGIVRFTGAYANEGGAYTNTYGLEHTSKYSENSTLSNYYIGGVFLVSDGGTTLSSILNPNLNLNNPNAPVNTTPTAPTDVSVTAPISLGAAGMLLGLFGLRRRKQ